MKRFTLHTRKINFIIIPLNKPPHLYLAEPSNKPGSLPQNITASRKHLPSAGFELTPGRRPAVFRRRKRRLQSQLTIRRALPSDTGSYECRARNRLGEDSKRVRVSVGRRRPRPTLRPRPTRPDKPRPREYGYIGVMEGYRRVKSGILP